jgi:predicted Zn finger-like uncharacterized protein
MQLRCPQCGARYRIRDEKVRAGARVRCPKCNDIFPVQVAADLAAKSCASQKTAVPDLQKPRPRVVLVEDARYFREMIRDVLAPLNPDFHEAADGVEGLRIIEQFRPDLVILDLNLPEMNGYELMKAIRCRAALRDTRILAMSGVFRKEGDQEAAQQAGADEFIGKSFTPDFLLERVNHLLGLSS